MAGDEGADDKINIDTVVNEESCVEMLTMLLFKMADDEKKDPDTVEADTLWEPVAVQFREAMETLDPTAEKVTVEMLKAKFTAQWPAMVEQAKADVMDGIDDEEDEEGEEDEELMMEELEDEDDADDAGGEGGDKKDDEGGRKRAADGAGGDAKRAKAG
eukprot:TRINITY_DN21119_c0_g1_i4.p3 TRINITY_DN21119_c0_g1~~TRINITY_DN21119_c0_g1_i4.p3  ORF type:complete len:184 (+),score=106.46 TRINITY_DN21119_c0_g1_i4:78-554(+)